MPPLMPAAKLRPVAPSTTTRPPVMYSQPWSPTPSTTVSTPVLRTSKPSPARPAHREDAAGHALPCVVVGVAVERERHAGSTPRGKGLAGRAPEVDLDR